MVGRTLLTKSAGTANAAGRNRSFGVESFYDVAVTLFVLGWDYLIEIQLIHSPSLSSNYLAMQLAVESSRYHIFVVKNTPHYANFDLCSVPPASCRHVCHFAPLAVVHIRSLPLQSCRVIATGWLSLGCLLIGFFI